LKYIVVVWLPSIYSVSSMCVEEILKYDSKFVRSIVLMSLD